MLVCKQCGANINIGVRTNLCQVCIRKRKAEYANKRYHSSPQKVRTRYSLICSICSQPFISFRKTSFMCTNCIKELKDFNRPFNTTNKYIKDKERDKHRTLAEAVLDRKLSYDEVIHHFNEDYLNNSLENLVLLSRSVHARLHHYLQIQRFIIHKKENSLDRYYSSIKDITLKWFLDNEIMYLILADFTRKL